MLEIYDPLSGGYEEPFSRVESTEATRISEDPWDCLCETGKQAARRQKLIRNIRCPVSRKSL